MQEEEDKDMEIDHEEGEAKKVVEKKKGPLHNLFFGKLKRDVLK